MDEIFYIMRHGGGGFSFSDCYEMPIQIRKYNVRKLSSEIQEENKRIEDAKKGPNNKSLSDLATGDASAFSKQPDYIAKAPRK